MMNTTMNNEEILLHADDNMTRLLSLMCGIVSTNLAAKRLRELHLEEEHSVLYSHAQKEPVMRMFQEDVLVRTMNKYRCAHTTTLLAKKGKNVNAVS